MDLTVQDVHDFVDEINFARMKAGMKVLKEIEFDACDPGNGFNCLSARHLFRPLGAIVNPHTVSPSSGPDGKALAEILGTSVARGREARIPEAILKVTSVFDDAAELGHPEEILDPLRELFVEAGYVDVE